MLRILQKHFMRFLLLTGLFFTTLVSCKDQDDSIALREYDFEIEDFIWEALNTYYYWQDTVPDLADNRFNSQKSYASFLSRSNENQEQLFESLLFDKDRFSWIVSDYTALENQLRRVYTTSGMILGLERIGESNDLFAYVRYVLPDSDASEKNIKRGDLFLSINNEQLTMDNYRELLRSDVELFSIQLAQISGQTVSPTGLSVDLVKAEIQENPIHIHKLIELNNAKIAYLMYNGFVADFDDQLESAFAEFQTQGINQLVIDLRYNRGGRTSSSIKLASMITGQFSGEVFAQTQHNDKLSSYNEDYLFEATAAQLKMDRLYVIALQKRHRPVNSLSMGYRPISM